jgi:hypothetical protein
LLGLEHLCKLMDEANPPEKRGPYQHCSEKHLHRYLAEFDFRFNRREKLGWTDEARTVAAVKAGG